MRKSNQKKWPLKKRAQSVGLLFLSLLLFVTASQADQARYIYDELGRLQAEIDAEGNAAVYNYDSVGNLLSITRSNVSPSGVSITYFTPQSGPEGTTVTIYGKGFSATPNQNTVTFNGTAATVTSATSTQIVTTVPSGATTGLIAVTTPSGSATSSTPFSVTLPNPVGITISPLTATIIAGTSLQFTVTVTGTANQGVFWNMESNGSMPGTLSSTGLYTVPSSFTSTALMKIRATSIADPTKSTIATVTVLPSGSLGPIVAPQVSVAIDQAGMASGPFVAPQVSVAIDQAGMASGPFVAPQVSVAIDQAGIASGPFIAPQVSVAIIPIITAVTPNSGAQGAVNLPVTLTGTGLAGATSLSFLLNGATDTGITGSNVTANADGTQATALLTISASATTGTRVVRIISANGTSPAAMMEGNTFTVTTP